MHSEPDAFSFSLYRQAEKEDRAPRPMEQYYCGPDNIQMPTSSTHFLDLLCGYWSKGDCRIGTPLVTGLGIKWGLHVPQSGLPRYSKTRVCNLGKTVLEDRQNHAPELVNRRNGPFQVACPRLWT